MISRRYLVVLSLLVAGLAACGRDETGGEGLYERARLELRRGFLQEALRLAEEGLRAGDARSPEGGRFLLLKAETLLALGRTAEAANLLDEAFPSGREQDSLEARRLMLLGQATHGFLPSASPDLLEFLSRAQERAVRAGSPELLAEIEWRQAYALSLQDQFDSAVAALESALAKARESGDPFLEATVLGNLGVVYRDRGRFDEAIPWFETSLELARVAGALRTESAVRQSLGVCYNRLGEHERARLMIAKAAELSAKLGDAAIEQNCLASLGNLHHDLGEYELAVERFNDALALARKTGDGLRESRWLNNLAASLLALGDLDAAERHNERSLALKERLGEDPGFPLLHRAQIAAARRQFEQAAGMFRELTTQNSERRYPAIRWEAYAGLAGVLRATGRPEQARISFRRAIDAIDEARRSLRSEEFKPGFHERVFRFNRDYVEFLLERRETVAALEAAESARAKVLRDRLQAGESTDPASAARFRDLARRMDAVLLSYWLAPGRSVVWVVAPGGVIMRELKADAAGLAALVDSHQAAIANQRDIAASGHPAGRRLFELLIQPVRDLIPKAGRVVVVPDGPLYGLNLETLLTGFEEDARYWIEDATIVVAPSLAALNPAPPAPRPRDSLLLIGDPAPAAKEYPRLEHAHAEMAAIQERFHGREIAVLDGEQARPAAYAAAQPSFFTVIHFAAHATANSRTPLDSAIILSPDSGSYKLYSRDIMATPVQADLVTISACHSAGTRRYAGEGLIGFAWAFLYAGARNVIGGLWEAPDRATAQLMDSLYAGLVRGMDPADALRAAKLELLHSEGAYRKPYYWAPFQVYTRSGVRRDLHLTN